MSSDVDRPDYKKADYLAMLPSIELLRDVIAGTDRLRDAGVKYLPRHPKEQAVNYNARVSMSTLFGATERTVSGLSGMVFQRDPVPYRSSDQGNDRRAGGILQRLHGGGIDLLFRQNSQGAFFALTRRPRRHD